MNNRFNRYAFISVTKNHNGHKPGLQGHILSYGYKCAER